MKKSLVALLFALGCGHHNGSIDNTIGATCVSDRDCDHRCYTGGDFPGGFCSMPCLADADCPDDALCMSESGGVRMFTCPPFDCTRLGPGWKCSDQDLLGGGKANVCGGG